MIYLDSSALIKLVIDEVESAALEHWLVMQEEPVVTSALGRTELVRACRRIDPAAVATAHLLLGDLPLMSLSSRVLELAENIGPPGLRSLDALHLASAFELGESLTAFVTYDKRLRDSALLTNLPVMMPGAA